MKKNPISQILVYFCLTFLLLSCGKDELTKPAAVSLQMEMEEKEVSLQEQETESLIVIERARYRFSSLNFEGYRQIGNDYFFSNEFQDPMDVWVETDRLSEILDFDMPQGEYDQVKISLQVKKSGEVASGGGKKRAQNEKPFNENAAIIMEGFYTNSRQEQVPLIFVYDFDETFDYTAQGGSGPKAILIDKAQSNQAVIGFDAAYWMQLINARMLQSAKLTDVDGEPTIVISADKNEHIFTLLSSRLRNASKLTFK